MKKIFTFLLFSIFGFTTLAFSQQSYQVDLSQRIINTSASTGKVDCSVGPGVYYNSHYGNSWLMHYPGVSYLKVTFNKETNTGDQALLTLVHLASTVHGKYYAPISLLVNDQCLVSGFSPASNGYITDTFDLTGYLHDGLNTLQLNFDENAPCNYWIQSLKIEVTE